MIDPESPHSDKTNRIGDAGTWSLGRRLSRLRDPYHLVLTLTWPQFFGGLLLIYALVNLLFGGIYWLLPGSVTNTHAGAFLDCFFFSIETLATVGYGVMAPADLAGHVVASIEILSGMVGFALTTGLIFARFSKPTARIVFSRLAVIRDFDNQHALMLRMANERQNRIVEATAKLWLVRRELNAEGESYVRLYDLPLLHERTPVFSLTWTIIHPIDDSSPLRGLDTARLVSDGARIVVSVTGHDETMAASVYAGSEYDAKDLVFGGRFVDVLSTTPSGVVMVDMAHFQDIERPTEQTGTSHQG
jgi:inward rectifier potassium channel